MPVVSDESNPPSHHNLTSGSERLGARTAQSAAIYNREVSTVRGIAADHSTLQPQNTRRGQSHSKSPDTPGGRSAAYDVGLERRPSNSSYGHHRQTSIVHGIQHSRNPSFATSSTTSTPLSPELIASLGRGGGFESENNGVGRLGQPDGHASHQQAPGANGASQGMQGTLRTAEGQDTIEVTNGTSTNPLHRRITSSGRPWREHSHSRSHSKHQHGDFKSAGEYALHHLFNSVRIYFPFP